LKGEVSVAYPPFGLSKPGACSSSAVFHSSKKLNHSLLRSHSSPHPLALFEEISLEIQTAEPNSKLLLRKHHLNFKRNTEIPTTPKQTTD
jgi:hypothetical protein